MMQKWREVFAGAVKARTGKWRYRGYDWHAFSYNFSRALTGAEALAAYGAQQATEYAVIPEDEDLPAYRCRGHFLPDFSALFLDAYIFDASYIWTMVFTHEDECGPYFSRPEWQGS